MLVYMLILKEVVLKFKTEPQNTFTEFNGLNELFY